MPQQVLGRTLVRPMLSGSSAVSRIFQAKSWCYIDVANPNSNLGLGAASLQAQSDVANSYDGVAAGTKAIVNFEQPLVVQTNALSRVAKLYCGMSALNNGANFTYSGSITGLQSVLFACDVLVQAIVFPFTTSLVTWNNIGSLGSLITLARARVASSYTTYNPSAAFSLLGGTTAYARMNDTNLGFGNVNELEYFFDLALGGSTTIYGFVVSVKPVAIVPGTITVATAYALAQLNFAASRPEFILPSSY